MYRVDYNKNLESYKKLGKTYLKYNLTNLDSNTFYEMVLKTFTSLKSGNENEAQSAVTYFQTSSDYPKQIQWVRTLNKTNSSITLEWSAPQANDIRDFVHVEQIFHPFNKTEIGLRDYCNFRMDPVTKMYSDNLVEGCCSKKLEKADDIKFEEDLAKSFECSLKNRHNCDLKLAKNQNTYYENQGTLRNLQFGTYIFKIYPCNALGCGNYIYYSEVPLFNIENEAVQAKQVHACREGNDKYKIQLPKPEKTPVGIIHSYIMRFYDNIDEGRKPATVCVTQRQQEEKDHLVSTDFANNPRKFEELQIETYSLAGSYSDLDYIDIMDCGDWSMWSNSEYSTTEVSVISVIVTIVIISVIALIYVYRDKIRNYVNIFNAYNRHESEEAPDDSILMEEFSFNRAETFE